jgi:hypothetical protein
MAATEIFFKNPDKGTTLTVDGSGVNLGPEGWLTDADGEPIDATPGQSATFHIWINPGDELASHHIYRLVDPDWKDDVVRSSWNVQHRFMVFDSMEDFVANAAMVFDRKDGFAVTPLIRGKPQLFCFGYQMFPKQSGALAGTYFDTLLILKVKDRGGAAYAGLEKTIPIRVKIA